MGEANPERLAWTGGAAGGDLSARWVADVERAAGLPAGTIARFLARRLAEEWAAAGPGGCVRWLDAHFPFEGEAEEKAEIARALYRVECRRRAEAEAESSRGLGWS